MLLFLVLNTNEIWGQCQPVWDLLTQQVNIANVDELTVQAVRNVTLILQKRTKTKSCEFVRIFSKISEFAN